MTFLVSRWFHIYVQLAAAESRLDRFDQFSPNIYFFRHVCLIQVTIAPGFHLFPFRTEKLSPVTPMVLRNSGRVGSRRFFLKDPLATRNGGKGISAFRGGGKKRREMGEWRGEKWAALSRCMALLYYPF